MKLRDPDLPFRCGENRSVAFAVRSRGLTSFGRRLGLRDIPADNNSPIRGVVVLNYDTLQTRKIGGGYARERTKRNFV